MSNLTEIRGLQDLMLQNHDKLDTLTENLVEALGNGDKPGISIDLLLEFANAVIKLNKQLETMSAKHKELMAK